MSSSAAQPAILRLIMATLTFNRSKSISNSRQALMFETIAANLSAASISAWSSVNRAVRYFWRSSVSLGLNMLKSMSCAFDLHLLDSQLTGCACMGRSTHYSPAGSTRRRCRSGSVSEEASEAVRRRVSPVPPGGHRRGTWSA